MSKDAQADRLISDLAKVTGLAYPRLWAAVRLLNEGNTVPFIARYRKDQTENLTDEDLRLLVKEKERLQKLYEKQADTLRLLDEIGKLTPDLEKQILAADRSAVVDELYRPFRPRRRTRATVAREKGLEPLAKALRTGDFKTAQALTDRLCQRREGPCTPEEAWGGAGDILAEAISDSPSVRSSLKKSLTKDPVLLAEPTKHSKTEAGSKQADLYRAYLNNRFAPNRLKGYQILAMRRAEQQNLLKLSLQEDVEDYAEQVYQKLVQADFFKAGPGPITGWQRNIAADAWKRLLKPSLLNEIKSSLVEAAEAEALEIFASNLEQILLAPPLRNHTVLAFDPGFRNGCKLAVTDPHGGLLATAVIYPVVPQKQEKQAAALLDEFLDSYPIDVLALGNGTATRETEAFIRTWQEGALSGKSNDLPLVIVNEAGASVYSASAVGAAEFPDLPVEVRSAVSLARRLQDPLAELTKIEPEAIGVGQYQHDINPGQLSTRLNEVVEAAVNRVGADLNTASVSLLARISGLNRKTAEQVVSRREEKGGFTSRAELLGVKGLGPKSYQQCAGFLRVSNPAEPLDNTFIHPESYPLAKDLLARLIPSESLQQLEERLVNGKGVILADVADRYGRKKLLTDLAISPTRLTDLLNDLAKAGRDDRKDLEIVSRSASVTDIDDLKVGMVLRGTVRNVVQFGAFVDIGIHQDGLVHISEMADHFVSDPTKICRVGQVLDVKIIEVDRQRKRIALSLKQLEKNT